MNPNQVGNMLVATKTTVERCIDPGASYGDCNQKFLSFFGEELLQEAMEEWHGTLDRQMPRNNDGGYNKTHGEYHALVKLLGYWIPTMVGKNNDELHKASRILSILEKEKIQPPSTTGEATRLYHVYEKTKPRLAGALRVYAAAKFFKKSERDAGHMNALFFLAGIKND